MKNIVILLVDALRTSNLSLFGYNKETDRNLKEISKESFLFRLHFSTSNATAPAITSILTGKYPINHGIIHQLPYTKKEEIEKVEKTSFWLPTYLKNKDYETICIDWVGYWFKKDFDFYGETEDEKEIPDRIFISAKETIDLAISKIKQSKKPFFLLTHFWDSHFPFPNTEYRTESKEEDRIKTLEKIKNKKEREYLRKRIEKTNLCTFNDMANKYDAAIKGIDSEIGRFYNFLRMQNMLENTIFIILGDHGDSLTEHCIYFNHSGMYDNSIHVPMIMRLPGFGKHEISELTQHVDILPTILELLNFKTSEKFDGTSLMPLIKNNSPVREVVFAFDGLCNDIRTVRNKKRKLILAKDNFCNLCKGSHHGKIEEYDLEKDPGETNNIYSGKSEIEKYLKRETN